MYDLIYVSFNLAEVKVENELSYWWDVWFRNPIIELIKKRPKSTIFDTKTNTTRKYSTHRDYI